MKNKVRVWTGVFVVLAGLFFCGVSSFGADFDSILQKWSRTYTTKGELGDVLTITATYYSAEYIEALVQREAEKNLWTESEVENYKYELLKALQLEEYIPIMLSFDMKGAPLRMAPFDNKAILWVGGQKLTPADYDRRFNFKLSGKREGLVFFPRYDESGKSYLEGVSTLRLTIDGNIGPITMGKQIDFYWDVSKDDPSKLYEGRAASRLELERLIRRLNQLKEQKSKLEEQIAAIEKEIEMVEGRIEELEKE
ncbi:MAG: hypothetical protein GX487_10025 [Acetomicrobium flavidum]|uniref:hypothetical protein n=1 Tax=Acetomicrobium flavidum TaxID=49896 RepID=UPI0016AA83E1|nr:hypothetical protein [Acetomicrobium flavidum]